MNPAYIEGYISPTKPAVLAQSGTRDPMADTPSRVGIMPMAMKLSRKFVLAGTFSLFALSLLLPGLGPLGIGSAEAAIAFRNFAQAGTITTTLTINVPTGTLQNDVMIASIGFRMN